MGKFLADVIGRPAVTVRAGTLPSDHASGLVLNHVSASALLDVHRLVAHSASKVRGLATSLVGEVSREAFSEPSCPSP